MNSNNERYISIAGLIITAFNMFWLLRFEFAWNVFTYESWAMLVVGVLLSGVSKRKEPTRF